MKSMSQNIQITSPLRGEDGVRTLKRTTGGGEAARNLRKNQTHAEQKLWQAIRLRQLDNFKFRRQHRIGRYIVDFICLEAGLIIEVDGGQHNQSSSDKIRDSFLQQQGYAVLRFWNNEVLNNIGGVIEVILAALHHPHPASPLKGEEYMHEEAI